AGPIPFGQPPVGLVVARVGDGPLPSLAVADAGAADVAVLAGNGDGTFRGEAPNALGLLPLSIAAGPLTSDGNTDLAVGNIQAGTVTILMNDRQGTFRPLTPIPIGAVPTASGPSSIAAGDFNGNGHVDLAVTDNGTSDVTVLWGDGTGHFPTSTRVDYSQE